MTQGIKLRDSKDNSEDFYFGVDAVMSHVLHNNRSFYLVGIVEGVDVIYLEEVASIQFEFYPNNNKVFVRRYESLMSKDLINSGIFSKIKQGL